MAVKLRLSRGGSKKRPFYKIVAADVRAARDGKFIEKLGTYNPMLPQDHAQRVTLQAERVQYWLGTGAEPTDRVARLLGQLGVIEKPKYTVSPQKSAAGAKMKDRAEQKAEKLRAAEEAKNAPQESPAADTAA